MKGVVQDISDDELTADMVTEWLPKERLSLEYAPLLYDQSNERVSINVGAVVSDEQGDWIATLYVTDIEAEYIQALGWMLAEECWTRIGTWEDLNLEDARARSREWVGEIYPESRRLGRG